MDIASLGIQVRTDGVQQAARDLDRLDKQAGSTERSTRSLQGVMTGFKALLAGASIGLAVREYVRLADTYSMLNGKLSAVVKTSRQSAIVQAELFQQAQRTGSAFEDVVDLYSRLGASSETLAANQGNLLRVTDLVNKSIALSGADTAAAAAVTRQFAQALAAGALRGDEFVSVMEGAPRLARAIADGLDVPIGKLRELATEGRLTADVVTGALVNSGQTIDAEFTRMPATVGRAIQELRNSLLLLVGGSDQASGASRELAEAISGAARELAGMAREGNIAQNAATLLGAALRGGVSILKGYENAVARTSIAIEVLAGTITGLKEVQANVGLQGLFNDGSIIAGIEKIRQAGAEGQRQLDALIATQKRADDQARKPLAGIGAPSEPRRVIDLGPARAKRGRAASGRDPGRAEANQLEAAYRSLNASLSEQLALFGQTGEAARVRYQVENGELAKLLPAQKADLIAKAEMLDFREREQQAMEESLRKANEEVDARLRGQAVTQQLISDMQFELDLMGMTNAERERAIALRMADAHATDEQRAAIARLADQTSAAREVKAIMDDFKRGMGDAFADIVTGSKSAKDALRDLFDDLARQITRAIANKWIEQLFSAGGAGGGVGGFLSSLLGGGRAIGGPVSAGKLYEVGEYNRPEILRMHGRQYLIPGNAGTVQPASAMAGGGPRPVLNQTFVIQGRLDRRTEEQLSRKVGLQAARGMARTGR